MLIPLKYTKYSLYDLYNVVPSLFPYVFKSKLVSICIEESPVSVFLKCAVELITFKCFSDPASDNDPDTSGFPKKAVSEGAKS